MGVSASAQLASTPLLFKNNQLWAGGLGAMRVWGQERRSQLQAPLPIPGLRGKRRGGRAYLPFPGPICPSPAPSISCGAQGSPEAQPSRAGWLLNALQGRQVEQEGSGRETDTPPHLPAPTPHPAQPPLHPQCLHPQALTCHSLLSQASPCSPDIRP